MCGARKWRILDTLRKSYTKVLMHLPGGHAILTLIRDIGTNLSGSWDMCLSHVICVGYERELWEELS
jgi:hypothetical protein